MADILASGMVYYANLGSIINMMSDILGSGQLMNAALFGTAFLDAHIYVNESTATVTQLVDGVWDALASDYNTALTMGQKLNAAGTAGDPWVLYYLVDI